MAAEWTDANTKIVTELFAEQVRRGNRPNTHLNSVGFAEVSKRFEEMTGLSYQKSQLKNKWDKLKNEYGIWKKLMRKETGAGWNIEKGTIDQDSEWWKKAKVDIPGCGRFQKHGIRNEDQLKVMFEDITSDGTDHWSPATGMLPQMSTEAPPIINLVDGNNKDDETEVDESPTSAKCKRPAMLVDDKAKKPKTSQIMQDQITKIESLAERTQSSFESFTNKEETCSVKAVMDLVVDCGAAFDSDEYFIATELFVKREQREMFLHMPSPEILLKMPSYSMDRQKMIVAAAMTLHNYIREHDSEDEHFLMCDRDPDYVPTIPSRYQKYAISPNASDGSTLAENDLSMDTTRDELATAISLSW